MVIVYDPKSAVGHGTGWLDAPGDGRFDFTNCDATAAAISARDGRAQRARLH